MPNTHTETPFTYPTGKQQILHLPFLCGVLCVESVVQCAVWSWSCVECNVQSAMWIWSSWEFVGSLQVNDCNHPLRNRVPVHTYSSLLIHCKSFYIMHCNVWSVQCSIGCVQCGVNSVQCSVCSVQCAVCSVQCHSVRPPAPYTPGPLTAE